MITDGQLDTWLEDAKKATQGNMRVGEEINPSPFRWYVKGTKTVFAPTLTKEDAVHIANMSPVNAIAILEELKELRLLAEKIKWHEDNLGGTPTYILDMVNK